MRVFTRSIKEITLDDIEQLIEVGYPEDNHIEYKRALSGNSWEKEQKNIADKSKRKLVREIVAFANSDGGIIIVGVGETNNKPSRIEKIYSIPKVAELADRLKRSMFDHIEPKIPNLQVRGLITNEDEGLLIIKVEKSYQSPHRSLFDKECYTRRNDESITMTMREIKDLTVKTLNTFDDLQNRMVKRSNSFIENFKNNRTLYEYDLSDNKQSAVRITLIPYTNEIIFPKVFEYTDRDIFKGYQNLKANNGNKQTLKTFKLDRKRPIVRGVLFFQGRTNLEIKEDGLLECISIDSQSKNLDDFGESEIYPYVNGAHLSGCLIETLNILELLKDKYDLANIQYLLEIEILTRISKENKFIILPYSYSKDLTRSYPLVNKSKVKLPQFSYSEKEDIEIILTQLNIDLAHLGGVEYNPSYELI